jgi:hypothetical protein
VEIAVSPLPDKNETLHSANYCRELAITVGIKSVLICGNISGYLEKLSLRPNSALRAKFYPGNIIYMPAVKCSLVP